MSVRSIRRRQKRHRSTRLAARRRFGDRILDAMRNDPGFCLTLTLQQMEDGQGTDLRSRGTRRSM